MGIILEKRMGEGLSAELNKIGKTWGKGKDQKSSTDTVNVLCHPVHTMDWVKSKSTYSVTVSNCSYCYCDVKKNENNFLK